MGNASDFEGFRSLALAVSLALGGIGYTATSLGASTNIAQQNHYDLPADTLRNTLNSISRQSGVDIQISVPDIDAYDSPAIFGSLDAVQAVAAALAETALQSGIGADGQLMVVDPGDAAPPAPIVADAEGPESIVLPSISVEGIAINDAYAASFSSSATRTNTALQETPQSIKTITQQVISDRQATSVDDALRNAAGVVTQRGNRGTTTYFVRGYEVTQTSVDGVSTPETRGGLQLPVTPIDGVEGLEVIKGPAAVMAGSSSPGGTVNLIRKAPVTEPLRVLRGELTNRNERKVAIDLGDAITDDKAWAYRLNVARTRSSETYPDYDGSSADYVAPVIAWRGDSTRLKVGAEFSDTHSARGLAGTFYNTRTGRIQDLPVNRMGDRDDHISAMSKTGYYELNQELVNGWSFNSKATYSDTELDLRIHQPLLEPQPSGSMLVNAFSSVNTARYWSLQNDIRGTFDTGPLAHEVLIGVDYLHSNNAQYEGPFTLRTTGNVYLPDTLDYPSIPTATQKSYDGRGIQRGLLLQDQITIADRLHLMFAGKQAQWNSQTRVVGSGGIDFEQKKWVPNYGIAYDLTYEITAYANLLNGFSGSTQVDVDGNQLAPSESRAKELGLKFSLLDDRLTMTTAVFDIEQSNVPVANQAGQFIGSEGRMSKGFDFDLNGQILPGWDLTFSYTYSKFDDPQAVASGPASRITGQPKHSANLWTTYQIQSGDFAGWGAGFGITAASGSYNGFRTSSYYRNPGHAQTDASIFYRQADWSLTLGVKNLFDREIYAYSTTPLWMSVNDGRTARLTGEYRF